MNTPMPTPVDKPLHEENKTLRAEIMQLKQRVEWFEKQLFGRKSEKRLDSNPLQPDLLAAELVAEPEQAEKITVTYQRGKGNKNRPDDCVTDSGLRFNDDVPVKTIVINPPELNGPDADQYKIIDTKITHRLAQRPASYVVLRYEVPVLKRKDSHKFVATHTPFNVLDSSLADVSFLVGLLVDKFQYHLPLYRQHQRIQQAGITLSRATLTNLTKRAINLLKPIVQAQLDNVLTSRVLAMDETPVKAGKSGKGKLKQAWFWPLYGDSDEVVFTYSASRGRQHIEKTLNGKFSGTLITDGYAAYARYAAKNETITHAQCWVHSRRYFVNAETQEPEAVASALSFIGELYRVEKDINTKELTGEKKQEYRLAHSKPILDNFFSWCQIQITRAELTPSCALIKALNYVVKREHKLRVYLEDPAVPLDTNYLERALRPIPLGRKNWLFCWTELGAEHVGIIQSLICTCKLHDINPYTYLTDVLQRIDRHPAKKVAELTPRLWKEHFAIKPLRSDLAGETVNGLE